MTPCPFCDEASVVDEHGCCIHCGEPRELGPLERLHRELVERDQADLDAVEPD